jgi:hypothetical protein
MWNYTYKHGLYTNEFKYHLEMYHKAKCWHIGDTMRQSRNTAYGRRTTVVEKVTTFENAIQEVPLLLRNFALIVRSLCRMEL